MRRASIAFDFDKSKHSIVCFTSRISPKSTPISVDSVLNMIAVDEHFFSFETGYLRMLISIEKIVFDSVLSVCFLGRQTAEYKELGRGQVQGLFLVFRMHKNKWTTIITCTGIPKDFWSIVFPNVIHRVVRQSKITPAPQS